MDDGLSTGLYTSIALGSDGNPLIAYYDDDAGALRVADCAEATCRTGTVITTVDDSSAAVGLYTSLVLGADGNPVIAYVDAIQDDLKVANCADPACGSGTVITTVDSGPNVGGETSMVLDDDGNPIIAYHQDTSVNALKVADCADPACGSGTVITTVDSAPRSSYGVGASIILGADGNPIISYQADGLRVAGCVDPACATGTDITLVTTAGTGPTSIALGVDGHPVISFRRFTSELQVAACADTTCTTGATVSTVDAAGVGAWNSMALDGDGAPMISYFATGVLKLAECGDPACAEAATITLVDGSGTVGQYNSIVLDSDGMPVISYFDRTNGVLKVARRGANEPPDCSIVTPSVDSVWPPSHHFVGIEVLGVTDPDADPLSITIGSIFQDEPVDSAGAGAFVPDGQLVGTSTAEIRAERNGGGNGRVYHIAFTAEDGKGGSCSGEVRVGVPMSQGENVAPVDDGALYDSMASP